MDTDRVLGALLVAGVIVAGILYFGSFIFPWSYSTAVLVIVSIGFVVLLGIGGWIGWTMASTPTPEAVEDLDMEEIEEEVPELEEGEEAIEIPGEGEKQAEEAKEFREELTSIRGMTDRRVENLISAGYGDVESLEDATTDDLKGVEGIGSTLAERIRKRFRG